MSSIATPVTAPQEHLHTERPSFFGIVRGELFKVRCMWSTWITLILVALIICLINIIMLAVPSDATDLKAQPLPYMYNVTEVNLFVLRAFIGFFLIILTANVFGREYQLGTIRILLARGVGRLQLLFAKLLAVTIVAVLAFAGYLLLNVILEAVQMLVMQGNFNALNALDAAFWSNIWIYLLTILISMGVTILLTVAMTAIGRSLTVGLSVSFAFFPADNIGTVFMLLGHRLTGSDFWLNITAYWLGPNLNQMPNAIVPAYFHNPTASPLVDVDGTHTLLVALAYAIVFAAVAIILTWKRDVKE